MKCVPNIPFDTDNALSLDLYLPPSLSARACVIYAHGGGFRKGSREDGAAPHFAQALTAAGFAMASVSYRLNTSYDAFSEQDQSYIRAYCGRTQSVGLGLSPKLYGPAFMAATEDLSRAIEFLWVEGRNLGISSRKTGLLGVSAGGIAGLSLAFPPSHWRERLVKPDAVVAISSALVQPWRLNAEAPPCLLLHGVNDRVIDISDPEFAASRAAQVGAPMRLINTGVRGHASQVDAVLDGATYDGQVPLMDMILQHFQVMFE